MLGNDSLWISFSSLQCNPSIGVCVLSKSQGRISTHIFIL